jgi:hypothetical protein
MKTTDGIWGEDTVDERRSERTKMQEADPSAGNFSKNFKNNFSPVHAPKRRFVTTEDSDLDQTRFNVSFRLLATGTVRLCDRIEQIQSQADSWEFGVGGQIGWGQRLRQSIPWQYHDREVSSWSFPVRSSELNLDASLTQWLSVD